MSYNQKLDDRIDHYLITNEELIKNRELGWVGWLLNGHMCFGIYGDLLIIRLDPPLTDALLQKEGVEQFKQAEQTAGRILSIAANVYQDDEVLFRLLERSIKYTSSLPPKKDPDDQQTEPLY